MFSHKLFLEGNRTLFNEGKDALRLQVNDEEGHKIQEIGFQCILYNEQLWEDKAALLAIMNGDRLNCELSAYYRVQQPEDDQHQPPGEVSEKSQEDQQHLTEETAHSQPAEDGIPAQAWRPEDCCNGKMSGPQPTVDTLPDQNTEDMAHGPHKKPKSRNKMQTYTHMKKIADECDKVRALQVYKPKELPATGSQPTS